MPKSSGSNIHIKNVKGNVVISNSQSGGVTSHEHNINSSSPIKKPFYKKILFWIGVISSVLSILGYLGFQPKTKENKRLIPKTISSNIPGANHIDNKKVTLIGNPNYKKPSLKKKTMQSEEKSSNDKPIFVKNVKGDVVISNNQTGGYTAHTINITSEKFQDLTSENKSTILIKLDDLFKRYPNHPLIMIQVESGDNMRNKVAMEFESLLSQYNAGIYPKGNTIMGFAPDYPVTIILNPNNKNYIEDFLKSIKPFITSDYHFDYLEKFDPKFIKFHINGKPTFDQNGSVTIN